MEHGDNQQPNNNGGNNGADSSNHPEVPEGGNFTHQVEHSGVVCDSCNTQIAGFRYKCLQCADFDLCSTCERRGLHAGHIMMRIAFPEQATEAIRRFFSPPSSPRHGRHFKPTFTPSPHGHGHGHFRHSFHGRGEKGHKKHHGKKSSSESSEDEAAANVAGVEAPQCQYAMSKKELKRLSKCMRKATHHGKKSAEAFAQAASNSAGRSVADYAAVMTQIQEYLNAFGIPIDVVTMYDQWGNSTSTGRPTSAPQPSATATTEAATTTERTIPVRVESSSVTPPAAVNVSDPSSVGIENQLRGLHIVNGIRTDPGLAAFGSLTRQENVISAQEQGIRKAGTAADVEGDADWTMLEVDKVPETTVTNGSAVSSASSNSGSVESTATAPPLIDISSEPPSVTATADSLGQGVGHPIVRHIPITVNTDSQTPNNTPVNGAPTGPTTTTAPLYPQLPLNFHQVMSDVSNSIGTALRNIPIVKPPPPPPVVAPVIPAPAPVVAPGQTGPQSIPMLDARMTMTLNQLLSMGFSNHDGWLARLVASKNGDLDSVLNALFPTEQQ